LPAVNRLVVWPSAVAISTTSLPVSGVAGSRRKAKVSRASCANTPSGCTVIGSTPACGTGCALRWSTSGVRRAAPTVTAIVLWRLPAKVTSATIRLPAASARNAAGSAAASVS
jgi:hypothetical protein